MALATYTVRSGDNLTWICNGTRGANVRDSIPGSTTAAKIDSLVRINNIPNRNLIYVGQVLKLSDGSSSYAPTPQPVDYGIPVINNFGLQSDNSSGRSMYASWSYSRENLAKYKVRWSYYQDGLWFIGSESETTSAASEYALGTYSAPSGAKQVKLRVAGVASEGQWSDVWSAEKIYDFSNNPPFPPQTPSVEVDDYTLIAEIDNLILEEINATSIEFEIIKNNTASLGTFKGVINIETRYVAIRQIVDSGSEYKVRARSVNNDKVSGWSDFSSNVGTKPSTPSEITTCRANARSNTDISAYLEWTSVPNAETYDIEYTTDISYFDHSSETTTITGIEFNKYEITGLALGDEYFFRVRAVNQNGESDWSGIKSVVLGTTPVSPTTWSSTNTAVVGEPLKLYWTHNSEDNSKQTFAEIRLYVNDVLIVPDETIKSDPDEEEIDNIHEYIVDTTKYPEGTNLKWQVRTAGITKVYGEWSVQREVNIYAQPTLALSVTTEPNGGEMIDILKSFPFYISALAGPSTQNPIGYEVQITASEYYETIDSDGSTKVVNKGDKIYNKHFDTTNALLIELSADSLDIEADINYTITCSVTMNSGLSTSTSKDIMAQWSETSYNLDALIEIDSVNLSASITPYSMDENEQLVSGLELSVYRREYDGTYTLLGEKIANTNSITIKDPYPALDYARYRLVGKEIATGAISYRDIPGIPIGGKSIIIQWSEDWTVFDSSETYTPERPVFSGSMLVLPYNINVSNSYALDNQLIKYIGRKNPVSYFGTQLGETASWSTEIPKDDTETLYGIRKLAIWTDKVYVREPSGTGYWATITVSYNQKYDSVVIPVTFEIVRVEGGN